MTEENNEAPASNEQAAEATSAATPVVAEAPKPKRQSEGEAPLHFWGLGRRKTSVARVRLKPGGSGQIYVVNHRLDPLAREIKRLKKNKKKPFANKTKEKNLPKLSQRKMEDYFCRHQDRQAILDPLKLTKCVDKFDVYINVRGGGMTGQAGAVRLGLARALIKYDEQLMDTLRESGFLTRDARVSERKKYGQRGARASFQFSKR